MAQGSSPPKLDFLGIGFTKAGSTWIYKLLEEHPDICISKIKETNFFINEELVNNPRNLSRYANFFWHYEDGQTVGEFSPSYITKEKALRQVKSLYPDTKFIISLRDPMERVISSFLYSKRFDKKIAQKDLEKELLSRFQGQREMYFPHMYKWFQEFPRENFLVIIFEEMVSDPQQKTREIFDFLGVDKEFIPKAIHKKTNPAHTFHLPRLQKILDYFHKKSKKYTLFSKIVKKTSFVNKIKSKINGLNRKPYQKPKISPEGKQKIRECFAGEIEKLEELIGKDLSIWK
jgi:hypothetical protein